MMVNKMVEIFRSKDTELVGLGGYGRKYVADIKFQAPLETAGVIYVKIPAGYKTEPHAHMNLEEIFVIMNSTRMGIVDTVYDFQQGDVILVEPGEAHWFEAPHGSDVVVIAIKLPNLKNDKVSPIDA
jgi:quercetin dioxygenase-like cupin family protein